jgi:sorbitol-specific phosphotransferase system component IIA
MIAVGNILDKLVCKSSLLVQILREGPSRSIQIYNLRMALAEDHDQPEDCKEYHLSNGKQLSLCICCHRGRQVQFKAKANRQTPRTSVARVSLHHLGHQAFKFRSRFV